MVIGGKLSSSHATLFPHLRDDNHTISSPQDTRYNCIAYAASCVDKWWWPSGGNPDGYWPPGVPHEESVGAFVLAFQSVGYAPCELDGTLRQGYEKIAIYAVSGQVKHAARQLPNGDWTSKLGKGVDLEHELHAIDGDFYGFPVQFMIRHHLITALYDYP
jgi:hypothetical protein